MTKLNFDLLERSDQVLVLMLILKEFQEMLWLHFLWKIDEQYSPMTEMKQIIEFINEMQKEVDERFGIRDTCM